MRNRFICLTLSMLMLMTVLLTGCNKEKDTADVEQISGITLTMWVITDKEVANTDAEMAALKAELLAQYGEGDAYNEAVAEAEATRAAYERVEAEITKITKSKFKVNLDLYYYTEEQYYGVQEFDRDKYDDLKMTSDEEAAEYLEKCGKLTEIMILNEEYIALKEKAAKELKRFLKDAKAEGRTDTEKLKEEFYAENPQYKEFANATDDEDEEETGVVEEVTAYNEYEIAEIVYPELRKNQVDIIYLSGFDRYNDFIDNEWIQPLDEEIAGASRKLTDYISGTLLSGVQIDGSTYAIPNNVSIGEYTYMMIDKQLFDKYYYTIEDVEDVLDTKYFLADIVKFEPDVLPLNSTYEECMSMLVWYWSMTYEEQEAEEEEGGDIGDIGSDSSEEDKEPVKLYNYYYDKEGTTFSMFGTVYGGAANRNRGSIRLQFSNLFTKSDYLDILRELMSFKFEGYFGEAAEGQTVAVDFIKGDSTFKKEMESKGYCTYNGKTYYAIIAEYPEATENELYGNMFAVSAYSHFAVGRSMDIITYLNTNSTIRNLLQYGVEGKDYEISEPSEGSVLTKLSDDYRMTLEKTGNVFMAHPGEGKRADAWEGAREQNNESLIDPLLGFDFNTMLDGDENGMDCDAIYGVTKEDQEDPKYVPSGMIEKMTVKSAEIQARLDACTNVNELEDLITALAEELKESKADNKWIKKANNPAYDADADKDGGTPDDPSDDDLTKGNSPYTVYVNWLTEYGYDVPAN